MQTIFSPKGIRKYDYIRELLLANSTYIPFYPTVKLYPFSPGAECKSDEQESKEASRRDENEKREQKGGKKRGRARGTWWIFQRSQSEGSNGVKGLSSLFFETRNRGSFRVTLLERHAKTTRDSLESCAHACASMCEPSEDLERSQRLLSDAASAFRRCENSTGTTNSYLHIRGFSRSAAISLISKWNDVTHAKYRPRKFDFSSPFFSFRLSLFSRYSNLCDIDRDILLVEGVTGL